MQGQSLEKQRAESRRALEENQQRDEILRLEKLRKEKKARKLKSGFLGIFLIVSALSAYAMFSPGQYDSFAKCLTEKGAIMYGEDWCQYTQGQKGMFGKSFKYVNYVQKEGLKLRPTWVINGETHETVQSFQTLSALTGCEY